MADLRTRLHNKDRATVIGVGLTALWVLMLAVFWLTSAGAGAGPGRWVSVVAALSPLALIWIAVRLAREIEALRSDAADMRAFLLQQSNDDPRAAATPPAQARALSAKKASGASAQTRPTRAQTVRSVQANPPADRRPGARASPAAASDTQAKPDDARQSSLGFDAPEAVLLPPETLIRALNFPDGPDDHEAVQALRVALRDPDHARLLRSAQDVVTLLAERGIFTDDLVPEQADSAAWRRFADGQRGRSVAGVGAIREPESLEAATAAMRADEVFRDAVHHFLRLFDRGVTSMVPEITDNEIAWLTETRSARAFMLLARAAGLFGQDADQN